MNSLIQAYRRDVPTDTRSDEELLVDFGRQATPQFLAQYPDFAADWQKYQVQQNVEESSLATEFGRGVKRGVLGLEATAFGLGALATDALGLTGPRNWMLEGYKGRQEKIAEEAPPSVPSIKTAFSLGPRALWQYVAGEAGALVPNLAEAVGAATAGAMVGSAVAPGVGTATGAAEGFFARNAAKAAVTQLLKKNPLISKELEEYATGKLLSSQLSKEAEAVIDAGTKSTVKNLAANVASGINFAAQGAGGAYAGLSQTPGVSDQEALEAAAIAGAGSSVGALIPAGILRHLFPGVGEQAAKSYVDIWAKKVPKEILSASSGMGAMEFFNILAEKHADPKKRNADFTDQDYERLLNAFTVGVLASGLAVGLTALRGVKAEEAPAEPKPPGKTTGAPPPPAMTSKEINRNFPSAKPLTPEEAKAMTEVIQNDIAGTLTDSDRAYLTELEKDQVRKAQYNTLKTEASNALKIREEQERVRLERERVNAQLRKEEEDRNKQAQEQAQGAEASARNRVQEDARRVEELLLLEPGELDRRKGESYADYTARFSQTVEAAQKAQEPAKPAIALPSPSDARSKAMAAAVEGKEPGLSQPWYVTNLRQIAEPLEKEGLAPKIEELSAQRMTAQEIARHLGIYGRRDLGIQTVQEATAAVRAVRSRLGIPSMDDQTEFEAWLAARKKTASPQPERVVAAATTNPETGATGVAASHVEAGGKVDVVEPKNPQDRETSNENFVVKNPATGETRIADRVEAGEVAKAAGQVVPSPEAKPGAPIHSDQIDPLDWIQKVSEKITGWITSWKDARSAGYSDLGTETGTKGSTKRLGVFITPDGKGKVVGTLSKNKGVEYVWLGGPYNRRWTDVLAEGYKPYGFAHLEEAQAKFFRSYSNEEWAPAEALLTDKINKVKVEAQPPVEEAAAREHEAEVASGTLTGVEGRVEQKISSDKTGEIEKPVAERIADAVHKEFGQPSESSARDNVLEAIGRDSGLVLKIGAIGGQNQIKLWGRIVEAYQRVAKEFEQKGIHDEDQFKARMIASLTGLKPVGEDLRFSVRRGPSPEPSGPALLQDFVTAAKGLSAAGIPVRVIQTQAHVLIREFVNAAGEKVKLYARAAYDSANRAVSVFLRDVTNPGHEGLMALFDEGVHVAFGNETKEMQDAILSANSRMREENLGLTLAELDDIRGAHPDGVPPELLQEERLAAAYAKLLMREGFSPDQSRGISGAIVRLIKDWFTRGLMWVQSNLLGRKYDNGALADIYFKNRVKSLLAGDQEILSWIHTLGGGKPTASEQVTFHTPVDGDVELAEYFDPQIGDVAFEPLVNDSLSATLFNLDHLRFSASSDDNTERYNDQTVQVNRERSVINAAARVTGLAAQSAGVTPDLVRKVFRLPDRQKQGAAIDMKAVGLGLERYNPNQLPNDFTHSSNRAASGIRAVREIENDQAKIWRRRDAMIEAKERLVPERDALIKKHDAAIAFFLDANQAARDLAQSVKSATLKAYRDLVSGGGRLGVIMQQLRDLEGTNKILPEKYYTAFQRLFTGNQLSGTTLFDLYDTITQDPSIDLTKSASKVRQDMIARGIEYTPYERLTQNDPDSRALLATIVGLAKLNQKTLALIEERRSTNTEERDALIQQVKDLKKQSRQQIETGIRELVGAVKVSTRLTMEGKKALREIFRANDKIAAADAGVEMAKKIEPVYSNELDRLYSQFKLGDQFEAVNGAKLHDPGSPDQKIGDMGSFTFAVGPGPHGEQLMDAKALEGVLERQFTWLQNREQAYAQGDQSALNYDYWTMKRENLRVIQSKLFEPYRQRSSLTKTELVMGPITEQFNAMGLPAADSLSKRVKAFVSDQKALVNHGNTAANHNQNLFNTALWEFDNRPGIVAKLFNRKDVTRAKWFEDEVVQRAMNIAEKAWDIAETPGLTDEQILDRVFQRISERLLARPEISEHAGKNWGRFMPALRKVVTDRNSFFKWAEGKARERGGDVEEPRVKGKSGKAVEREAFPQGPMTFPRRFSSYMASVVEALTQSGWELNAKNEDDSPTQIKTDLDQLAQRYNDGDTQWLQDFEQKYFHQATHGDTVIHGFVEEMAKKPGEPWFDAPVSADGTTRLPGDSAMIERAFDEADGNMIKFAELLFQYHDGEGDKGAYVGEVFQRMWDVFKEYGSAYKRNEGDGFETNSLKGISPPIFLDARVYSEAPDKWFRYHTGDTYDAARIVQRLAAQRNFGKSGVLLESDMRVVETELKQAAKRLKEVFDDAERKTRGSGKRNIEATAAALLPGGKAELKKLQKLVELQSVTRKARQGLNFYFHRNNSVDTSTAWPVRMAQTLASLDVNQFATMITRFSTTLDGLLHFGFSPASFQLTTEAIAGSVKELAGSLAQGIWFDVWRNSPEEDNYLRVIGPDPVSARRLGDITSYLEREEAPNAGFLGRAIAKFARGVRGVQEISINPRGEQARYTVLTPVAPVSMAFKIINKAGTIATWRLAKRFIGKGAEYLAAHPDAQEITAKDLGLGRLNGHTFEILKNDLKSYGMKFEELARNASERKRQGNGPWMTDNELARLCSLWDQEISIESSISTMPLAAYNNRLIRFIVPLLGWPYRRALQIDRLRLDTQGQNSVKALVYGMAGLTALGVGGLGVTLLQDAYSEHLLGKKRNLRNLRLPTTGEDWIAVNERLTRIGVYGMFGELVNEAVNTGTGEGDNRMLSVDGRVVALGSIRSLMQLTSALFNERFDPDYSHIVRPFIQAVGGNGMIQGMELINHAFDIDNVESRFIKRLSAENYLRVSGRDVGMEMRKGAPGGGGYYTPTRLTPWLSRMEMAAYGNDPDAFRAAHAGAVAEAKDMGKPDPADYVKREFEIRHPLKYVFAATPSVSDYQKILAANDTAGQDSIRDAIRLFNHYASSIGIKPFEGSLKKDQQKMFDPERVNRARMRALLGTVY